MFGCVPSGLFLSLTDCQRCSRAKLPHHPPQRCHSLPSYTQLQIQGMKRTANCKILQITPILHSQRKYIYPTTTLGTQRTIPPQFSKQLPQQTSLRAPWAIIQPIEYKKASVVDELRLPHNRSYCRGQYLLEGEIDWAWEVVMQASASWLLQGRSQPDRLRDWRPRPTSVTSGRPLAEDNSCESDMPPPLQLGKSILLPTAASSDSFRSGVRFRDRERQMKREGEVLNSQRAHLLQILHSPSREKKRAVATCERNGFFSNIKNRSDKNCLFSPPFALVDREANLLLLCPVRLPCISICITDPPNSM